MFQHTARVIEPSEPDACGMKLVHLLGPFQPIQCRQKDEAVLPREELGQCSGEYLYADSPLRVLDQEQLPGPLDVSDDRLSHIEPKLVTELLVPGNHGKGTPNAGSPTGGFRVNR